MAPLRKAGSSRSGHLLTYARGRRPLGSSRSGHLSLVARREDKGIKGLSSPSRKSGNARTCPTRKLALLPGSRRLAPSPPLYAPSTEGYRHRFSQARPNNKHPAAQLLLTEQTSETPAAQRVLRKNKQTKREPRCGCGRTIFSVLFSKYPLLKKKELIAMSTTARLLGINALAVELNTLLRVTAANCERQAER